ncbi:MAG: tetratricopeptide repeat protein [Anaerolineae bacterium]|nr:tetratricopeptide repeat protein [Anaerolineae bacterium]
MQDTPQVTELLKRGIAAAKAGRKEEARQALLQVIELDERNEQAWLWLSGVIDSVEDRRVCLDNVLAINPDNPYAQQGLRHLDRQAAAVPASAESCPRCKSPVPSSGKTCPNCGQVLIVACPSCGAYVEVEHVVCPDCGQFLGDFRDGAHYYLVLAQAYLDKQQFALAQETIALAEAEAPDDPQVLQAVAALHEKMSHTDMAVATYRRAIERYPEQSIYYARLGAIYRRRAMIEDARAMYEQAVKLDSNTPTTLLELAELYVEDGLMEKARGLLERAILIDPEYAKAHLLASEVYRRLGEDRLAVKHYRRAAELAGPESVVSRQAYRELAKLQPTLPERHTQGWGETLRRTSALMLPQILAAWVNASLVPWEISPAVLAALVLATTGAYLWACAADVPRNQAMRALFGETGVEGFWRKALVGIPGVLLWSAGFGLILGKI